MLEIPPGPARKNHGGKISEIDIKE